MQKNTATYRRGSKTLIKCNETRWLLEHKAFPSKQFRAHHPLPSRPQWQQQTDTHMAAVTLQPPEPTASLGWWIPLEVCFLIWNASAHRAPDMKYLTVARKGTQTTCPVILSCLPWTERTNVDSLWTQIAELLPEPCPWSFFHHPAEELCWQLAQTAATRRVKSYSWKQNPITSKMKAVTVPWSTEERSIPITFVFQDKLPRGQFHVSQGWFIPPVYGWRKAASILSFTSSKTETALYFDFHAPWLNAFQFRTVKLEGKLPADTNLQ